MLVEVDNTHEAEGEDILPPNLKGEDILPMLVDGTPVLEREKAKTVVEDAPIEVEVSIVPDPEPKPRVVFEPIVYHNINFESGKANLKDKSYDIIATIAGNLRRFPDIDITIEGHTDSDGSVEYNLDLSKRRAIAVKTALVNIHGISIHRLSTRGLGEGSPMATNDTTQGKALNRRVVIIPSRPKV
ncbi:MAG: OmpA family protein [Rhodobacter sp.]|nr:OmpA family protein [Rhodobacter sp.]